MFVYITQVLRSVLLVNLGSEKFNGITVNRYSPDKEFLSRTYVPNPDNSYYISGSTQVAAGKGKGWVYGGATPFDGVQDVTVLASFNAFLSRPYFLYGDPNLLTRGITVTTNGVPAEASTDLHDTFILVEPSSGLSLAGHKRLMASFALFNCTNAGQLCGAGFEPGLSITQVSGPFVPPGIIIPQYFMDENSQATSDNIDTFKKIMNIILAADVILVVASIAGFIGCMVGTVVLGRRYRSSKVDIDRTSK